MYTIHLLISVIGRRPEKSANKRGWRQSVLGPFHDNLHTFAWRYRGKYWKLTWIVSLYRDSEIG